MKLASFDIFDTVLMRKCGRPENIFYLLARRLYPQDRALREDFLQWRKNAERKAHGRNAGAEVCLEHIYADAGTESFAGYTPRQLMEAEKTVEAESLMAVPQTRALISRKRKDGYVICFISDMYLDSRLIAAILKREGCLEGKERVFVSCEQSARKSDGRLFDLVRKELKPAEWRHYGDNRHSDVKMPRRKGIKAVWMDTGFTSVEKKIQMKSGELRDSHTLSILSGLSRAARMKAGKDSFATIASDYVAPAYIPYVISILKDAQQRGVEQLFFLSRDSYILMKICRKLLLDCAGISLKYLFVSRKSLTLPYMIAANEDDFLKIMDKNTIMRKKVSSLLEQLNIDRDRLSERYRIIFHYEQITTQDEERDFLQKIFKSPFTAEFRQKAKEANQVLLDYFSQEGLCNGKKSAMVDVGWLGTTRLMINAILNRSGYDKVHFYYYGIRKDVLSIQYGIYNTFFQASQLSTEGTALIENYFSASPYPTTIGYEYKENQIIPKFPSGKKRMNTRITNANISIVEWIASEICKLGISDDYALFLWAKTSIESLTNLEGHIDLYPLTQCCDFDNQSFTRRLTIMEFIQLVLFGKTITGFDKASLQITCGKLLFKHLWMLRMFTGKCRQVLFLKRCSR